MDLYTFGTPNGHKISIALEELGLPYTVHRVDITKGEQFAPQFQKFNPNGKIPALVDGDIAVFESIAILIYLAEKTGKLLPASGNTRYATLAWCMFQASAIGPMMGQVGHFTVFAKEKIPYAIERYSNEVQRLFGVMETQLAQQRFLAGDAYSIADIATWPWLAAWVNFYKAPLDGEKFPSIFRWFREVEARPAVQRGVKVP